MNATTRSAIAQPSSGVIVAVDLAKSVFQLGVADRNWRRLESHRLTRTQFERWFINREVGLVIMEACGTAHHWARWLRSLGIDVVLLPAAYVRRYVLRNKTDAADAAALLEAARCADIDPVRIKSVDQQALQGLHRARSLWQASRTAHINTLRGFCREFGICIPKGATTAIKRIGLVVADLESAIPALLRPTMSALLQAIDDLDQRIDQIQKQLRTTARDNHACILLLSIPGIGLVTATGLVAATSGDVTHFHNSRSMGCWTGLTPKENSSGTRRRTGRISKQGDSYLRMLLTHGARSVLRAASAAHAAGKPLDPLYQWAVTLQARMHHNKATCAMANKLARICYATLRDHKPYDARTHFVAPHEASVAVA